MSKKILGLDKHETEESLPAIEVANGRDLVGFLVLLQLIKKENF